MAVTGPKPIPEEIRFFRFVEKGPSCWVWKGPRCGGRGYGWYGYFRIGSQVDGTRRCVYAHRWSYEHHVGLIPDGKQVNHHCDNPVCVNPKHLYVGTQADNVRDMIDRNRIVRGDKKVDSKLTEKEVIEIKKMLKEGKGPTAIWRMFPRVCRGTIQTIAIGRNWSWLKV